MGVFSYATAQLLRAIPRTHVSRAAGRLAERHWPPAIGRAVVGAYSRLYDVSFDECVDSSGWSSFDAFFTRALRDGARPIDPDPRTIVSPADGSLDSCSRVDEDGSFLVKGRPYTAKELLGSESEAKRYRGGAACVVYLSPRDYHRIHAPVSGRLSFVRSMPGDYFPVNQVGLRHIPNLFVRNRRVAIGLEADGGLGLVTVVMVAAMIVGRISVTGIDAGDVPLGLHHFGEAGQPIVRGAELGQFHLGSTAVCFFEHQAAGAWLAKIGPIRFGSAMLRASEATA